MITYFYWIGLIGLSAVVLYGAGVKAGNWKTGPAIASGTGHHQKLQSAHV